MGNVILTGFMGCGKSSVAIKLSYRLKKAMVDTDKVIEKKQGKTIAQIFEQDGEDAFRQMETDTLRALKQSSRNDIISVGGGTPMREENRALLKEMGTVVYLRVTPETVFERIRKDGSRPLLNCEDPQGKIRELLEKRGPLYEEGAHIIIDTDGKNFGQILFEIEKAVRSREMELRAQRQGYRENSQRKYDENKNYGGYGFNGFRRFGNTEGAASLSAGANESQHAQNIQAALSESTQRQDRWTRKPYQNYRNDVQEMEISEKEVPEIEVPENEAAEKEVKAEAVPETVEKKETETAVCVEKPCDEVPENAEQKRLTKLLVINGPNLNFLGIREKGIYGTQDYNYLLNLIAQKGIDCGAAIEVYQSNHEGAIIDRIQASYFDGTEGIVINPGAYTHYSYAIRDALASIVVPKVEVHISNIMEREPFRRISVTAPVCDKQIYGQGLDGYLQAIDFILDFKKNS